MSTPAVRQYSFTDDKNNGVPITASRVDAEHDNEITKLNQKVLIKSSAPDSPIAGMFWYDSTNKLLKELRNNEWIIHGMVHVGGTEPTTAQDGDLWYDTTNNVIKAYDTSSWVVKGNMTFPGSDAYGDIHYTALTVTALNRLARSGTAGLVLTNAGVSNTPLWGKVNLSGGIGVTGILPNTNLSGVVLYADSRIYLGSFTLTGLSGTQAVTGTPFTPNSVLFQTIGANNYTNGIDNGTIHSYTGIDTAGSIQTSVNYSMRYIKSDDANSSISAYISAFNSDGFTLTKSGTVATQTATVNYVAYR